MQLLDQLMVLSTELHKQFAYFPLNRPDVLLSWKRNLNEIHRSLLKKKKKFFFLASVSWLILFQVC